LQFFSWPERRVELGQVYARALQRIEIMDRTGYDAVWLAEHHFSSFSVCPSVHMMGVLAAARTTRLRIGTGVSLAPFYHPLRLAEEVALLDQVSGGRVNWGAGRGFARVEFENFGVPPDESTSRSATPPRRRARRRGPARNGSSIPISARSTTRSASPIRTRLASTACSAISTRSSCTALSTRCSIKSRSCARRSASTTSWLRRSATRPSAS